MPPMISYIYIATPPNKTTYFVGELFDPTGMVIKFFNGSSYQPITNYSYSQSGLLSLNDNLITVSLVQAFAFYLFLKHTKDVDLENSKEWYKFWRIFI